MRLERHPFDDAARAAPAVTAIRDDLAAVAVPSKNTSERSPHGDAPVGTRRSSTVIVISGSGPRVGAAMTTAIAQPRPGSSGLSPATMRSKRAFAASTDASSLKT